MSAWLTRPSNFLHCKLYQCKTGNLHSVCSKAYAGQKAKVMLSNVHKKRDSLRPPWWALYESAHFWFLDGPVWIQELDSMILMGPFQLGIFSDSFPVFGKETAGLFLTHITCDPLGTPWTKFSEEGKSWYLTSSATQPKQEWLIRKIGGALWASLDKFPFRLKGFRCLPSKLIADLKEEICSKWISPLLILQCTEHISAGHPAPPHIIKGDPSYPSSWLMVVGRCSLKDFSLLENHCDSSRSGAEWADG